MLNILLSFTLLSSAPLRLRLSPTACHQNHIKQHICSSAAFFVLFLCSFRAMSKQKCFLTNRFTIQKICSHEDKDILWLLYVRLSPLPLSRLPLTAPSLHPPLLSVVHLSLPFTNQYAGQQAVWQIVCCELHEKPLSIILVRYWIQSVVFSRVKWKDQRWAGAEACGSFSPVIAQLQVGCHWNVVLDVFTLRGNGVYQRCAQTASCSNCLWFFNRLSWLMGRHSWQSSGLPVVWFLAPYSWGLD